MREWIEKMAYGEKGSRDLVCSFPLNGATKVAQARLTTTLSGLSGGRSDGPQNIRRRVPMSPVPSTSTPPRDVQRKSAMINSQHQSSTAGSCRHLTLQHCFGRAPGLTEPGREWVSVSSRERSSGAWG